MNPIVPPGGFAGFSQMTPASRAALTPRGGTSSSSRRKRRGSKRSTKATTRRARKSGGTRKLKFGSPAWRKKYAGKAKRNAAKARRAKK